jgi:hypothetical protein
VPQVEALIQSAVDEGAKIVLDGRNPNVKKGYENGNFVGPTIITGVKPHMQVAPRARATRVCVALTFVSFSATRKRYSGRCSCAWKWTPSMRPLRSATGTHTGPPPPPRAHLYLWLSGAPPP